MEKTGKCLCGKVSLTISDCIDTFGACHCKMCQRWSGSALLSIKTPADKLSVNGKEYIKTHKSSDWAERAWCDECGSNLWYKITMDGPHKDMHFVSIGTLDSIDDLEMVNQIYIDEKPKAFDYANKTKMMTGAEVIASISSSDEG